MRKLPKVKKEDERPWVNQVVFFVDYFTADNKGKGIWISSDLYGYFAYSTDLLYKFRPTLEHIRGEGWVGMLVVSNVYSDFFFQDKRLSFRTYAFVEDV